jgi:SPFH domain / Band 7 family
VDSLLYLVLLVILVIAVGYGIKTNLRLVPTGKVGIVHRKFGRNDPRDVFPVRIGGSPGPRAATLRANQFYLLPSFLYRVTYEDRTFVPPGTIGVVVALAGTHPPLNQTLCEHVDCDSFQDGRAFLLGGGQTGRQPAILPGGAYYDINRLLFDVLTTETIGSGRYGLTSDDLREVSVPVGVTGVVIALEGAAPDDEASVGPVVPGHSCFQLPWVFLRNGGQRGAQAETLGQGGVYRINPWFARVVLIPTRDLILEWTKRTSKEDDNFDVALEQIRINVDGHWLKFDMSQTIRIPAKAAPSLVGRFGELEAGRSHPNVTPASGRAPVQRFVERVLGRTVENYFQAAAAGQNALEFMARHDEVRLELEARVRHALAVFGVDAISTTLNEFESESPALDEFRRERALRRDRGEILEWEHRNAQIKARIDRIEIDTEGERGVATLRAQLALLGQDVVATRLFLAELKAMNVPQWVSGDAKGLLDYLPMNVAHGLINKALRRAQTGTELPQQPPARPITRTADQAVISWDDDADSPET